jgi:RNA polymerase sigma-54 factor
MSRGASGDEDPKMEAMANTAGLGLSVHDYLLTQFRQLEPPAEYLPYAESIIYSLDGRGFFPDPIETVIPDPTPARIETAKRVLELIQTLDPPGIASPNEAACIIRQIQPDDPDAVALAELLTAHWDDLIRNKLPRVAQATSRPLEEIERLRDRLSQFNIRPAARFSPDEGGYVMPDVVIDKIDGEWRIVVDDERIPRVRLSPKVLEMYKDPETDEETKAYLKNKIQGAMWLLEAVDKRHSTLYRVAEKILIRQRDFFEHGIEALKPLKMQELATDLHIHVSTVSRAISDKWIQTPQGILPLKFFFAGGTSSDDGNEESRTSVKQRVADVVDAEDTANPLSDDDIAEQLKQKYGLDVARRTVTKYRKLLKIPSSRQRRRFA